MRTVGEVGAAAAAVGSNYLDKPSMTKMMKKQKTIRFTESSVIVLR
jgi:hypothetical protein